MTLDEHCQESIRLFGRSFEEVHRWLDEYAGSKECGMRHRRKRHHWDGIRQAVQLFGEAAGEAAWQHVISDLKMEGWTESDPFPRDETHYVAMGLF